MTAVWVWLAVAASYMLLVGQFSLEEMAAGALLGGLGVMWHRAVLGAGGRRFAFERRAAVAIARAAAGLPSATVKVGVRLGAALAGPVEGLRSERFFAGSRQDLPREAGRRAVVVLAASLAPDAYVLRVPLDEDRILYHALVDQKPVGDPRWPS